MHEQQLIQFLISCMSILMHRLQFTHIRKLDNRQSQLLVVDVPLNNLHNINRLYWTFWTQLLTDKLPVPCHCFVHILIHHLVKLVQQLWYARRAQVSEL